jgi:transcriptional regulator with XRE-family HTH domain
MPAGRPSDYRDEYADQARKLCLLLGATDSQLSDFFEVSEQTINKWKCKYPKFLESIKRGKEIADAKVAESLYHRALGYQHPEEKIFCTDGEIVRANTVKQYPPDPVACIFWLKNRQGAKWREKSEISGPNGGAIPVKVDREEIIAKIIGNREATNSVESEK